MVMRGGVGGVVAWCLGRAASEPASAGPVLNWRILGKPGVVAVCLAAVAGLNAVTNSGLQPIVVKFNRLDPLSTIYHIKWDSVSRIAAPSPMMSAPFLSGASPPPPGNLHLEP